jgi:organic radical activating enzyme
MMKKNNENAQKIKETLNEVGPGFCLAKWTQVTMHLGNGLNHSCHHPNTHKISVEQLKDNPSALHNTTYKKTVRKEMLAGHRPAECDYCWRIEDNTDQFSDRVYKSIEPWSLVDLEKIKKMTGSEDVYPRYVEISFSNVCNLKCSYCGPQFSSKWGQEVAEHGPYMLPSGIQFNDVAKQRQIPEREENPYVEAFWKWFPTAVTEMHTFRITGGEPLMSKHTMRVLELLLENPQPELEFSVNTNGNPPGKIFKEFTLKVQQLLDNNCIKSFTLFASAESVGKQAEFSRTGLNWDVFVNNIKFFLNNTTETQVMFMCAFNILSLPTFKDFLEFVYELKLGYNGNPTDSWIESLGFDRGGKHEERAKLKYTSRVGLDTPYVRHPEFLDAQILTHDLAKDYLLPAVDYMYQHKSCNEWTGNLGFEEWECQKFKRVVVDLITNLSIHNTLKHGLQNNPDIANKRADFYAWQKQYKDRRGLDLLEYFPEFKNFLDVCRLEVLKLADEVGGLYTEETANE